MFFPVVKQSSLLPSSSQISDLNKPTLLSAYSHAIAYIPYRDRFLFFRKHPSSSFEEIVVQMKQSIAKTLAQFYTLAGRISVRDDLRMELHCNNAGIMFTEAHCNSSLPAEDKFDLAMELLEKLCQAPGYEGKLKWPWPSDAPLLFVQVTQFSCGGFCLGLKYSHQLMDGASLWHFVKSWSEVSCGKPVSLVPDIIQDPIEIPESTCTAPEIPPGMVLARRKLNHLGPIDLVGVSQRLVTKRFRFGNFHLEALKTKHGSGFTKFQLLTSHIWRCVTKARDLDDIKDMTGLFFAINNRGRVPSLSKAYFGGGPVSIGFSSMSSAELKAASSLEQPACRIKKAISDCTPEHWETVYKAHAYYAGNPVDTILLSFVKGKDLLVGSSFYFPLYQEFAWGKPFEIAMAQAPTDGFMYYFPGQEPGGVDVYITLCETAMQKLEEDISFLFTS